MSFRPIPAGEAPSRIALGSVNATIAACRSYRMGGDTDYRRQARKLRLTASGFDRMAQYADEDKQPATARNARAEATRLRKLADDMEKDLASGVRALCVNGGGK